MGAGLDRNALVAAIESGRVEWRMHCLIRLAERSILQRDALNAVESGEEIEEYPSDLPYPSALFLGRTGDGRPLHVVASYDPFARKAYIITAYVPESGHFGPDWRTRRRL